MKQNKNNEASPELRRKSIEEDVAAFLAAGNKIDQVPSGLSAQDPQGRGKPLRLGTPKPQENTQAEDKQPQQPSQAD